jgi:hypothetical protein
MVQTTAPPPGAEPQPTRHRSRWWLWTLIGVAAAGTAAAVLIATTGGGKSDPPCPAGRMCQ